MKKKVADIVAEAKEAYKKGERLRLAMQSDPNFRAFIDSGSSNRVARLVSMAYLIASVFNAYCEEAVDLIAEYDMVHKKIKSSSNNLTQSFDSYNKAISALIDTQEAKLQLCSDYEIFKKVCDRFMNADVRVDDIKDKEPEQKPNTEAMKKPNPQKAPRKVVAYEGDGIKTFASAKEAAAHYGINNNTLYASSTAARRRTAAFHSTTNAGRTDTMKKAVLINHIHTIQDQLAIFGTEEFSANWVIGLLSQIAQDVANIEPEGEETNDTTDNDKHGI